MNLPDLSPTLATTLLVFAATPIHRVRQFALAIISFVARLALPCAVAACGAFALWPDLAPSHWIPMVNTATAAAGWSLPTEDTTLLWLGMAMLLVLMGLPLLAHLEYARTASALTALLAGLHRQAQIAVAVLRYPVASRSNNATPPPTYPESDVIAGAAVLRAVLESTQRHTQPQQPRTLVKDLISHPRS